MLKKRAACSNMRSFWTWSGSFRRGEGWGLSFDVRFRGVALLVGRGVFGRVGVREYEKWSKCDKKKLKLSHSRLRRSHGVYKKRIRLMYAPKMVYKPSKSTKRAQIRALKFFGLSRGVRRAFWLFAAVAALYSRVKFCLSKTDNPLQ